MRENWEKYGNPDGRGSFHVAIAMPRFLLDKKNQVPVLAVFFLILLVVVPAYFISGLDTTTKEAGGVDVNNRKMFF